MSLAFAGADALDYAPCSHGASNLIFRGPKQVSGAAYCATLGGTETFGKFVPAPWPALVAEATGHACVNLGAVNAGPGLWLGDPDVMAVARGAAVTVVQVVGAANLSNRLYTVHRRRNDRFLRASPWLRALYRDVDFTDFHFTRHLLGTLREASPSAFEVVVGELREAWTARMTELLRAAGRRTILLWVGDAAPPDDAARDCGRDPVLVTGSMVTALRSVATDYCEVVFSDAARTEGVEAMAFGPLDRAAATGVPGPRAHREIATAMAAVIGSAMG